MNDRIAVITLSLLVLSLSSVIAITMSTNVALAASPTARCYDDDAVLVEDRDENGNPYLRMVAFAEAGATLYGTDPLTSYGTLYGSTWLLGNSIFLMGCTAYYTAIYYETGYGIWEWITSDGIELSLYKNIPQGELGDYAIVSSGAYCGSITNPYVDAGVIAFLEGYCGT